MKKLLLLSIAVLFITKINAQSITWCPSGAMWHFVEGHSNSNSGRDGIRTVKYAGDNIVNNISCKRLEFFYSGRKNGGLSPITAIDEPMSWLTTYTYENNGVIYFLTDENVFDTVVNFNANIGDKWNRPGRCTDVITVTDTGHVVINGTNLKRIVTTGGEFIERLLTTVGDYGGDGFFPSYCFGLDSGAIVEYAVLRFRCYEDNNFLIYNNSSYGCTSITGIKENYSNKINLSVYPNPTSNMITIELPKTDTYKIKLTNLIGSVCKEISSANQKTEIDLKGFDSGIYFIQVFEKGSLVAAQKLVKE